MRNDNHDDGDYYFYYRHYGQDGGRFCDSDGKIVGTILLVLGIIFLLAMLFH